jgi:16S rRNA processing protein RimM
VFPVSEAPTSVSSASLTGEPAWPDDAIEVGRILGAWGIKGGFKVQAFSSDPQALFSSRRWFLKPAADSAARPVPAPKTVRSAAAASFPLPPLLKITQAREQGDAVVAQAQEVPDRNAAEALQGARVFVSRGSFPTAKADEYYWIDLIGLAVFNREGESLGTVIGLLDTGPHSVLRLQRDDAPEGAKPDEAERLIPFVAAYVDAVDLPGRRITVDWGLDY